MTFQEAKAKLQEIAGGKFNSIDYQETTYRDGETKQGCRLYIEDVKHTDFWPSWELAFDHLAKKIGEYDPTQAPE